MFDDLQQARDAWVDRLVTDVCERWGHKVELQLLAPPVQSDGLLLALVLSRIAACDACAWPALVIAEDLQRAGFLADVPTDRVVSEIVLPVVRVSRAQGAPWARWWDLHGLQLLLLELWTGCRLEESTEDAVTAELREIWRIEESVLTSLVHNSADPFKHMPPELAAESASGAVTQARREIDEASSKDLGRHADNLLGVHPELANRPDLTEVARRLRQRHVFKQTLSLIHDMQHVKRQAIGQELERFDRKMFSLLRSMTSYEVELIQGIGPDEFYRDRCLVAGNGQHEYWLLEDDALPPAMEFCSGGDVPGWIHDEVITGGGRSFRTNVGPHPVWLATAETPAQAASMRMLATTGSACAVKHEISDDEVVLWLTLPLAPGDPGPAAEIPYIYSLNVVNAAWQLLHLASVGHVRLTAVRLNDEGEPKLIGAAVLTIPPDASAKLTAVATAALRRLVGEDLQSILWRRGTEGLDQQEVSAFHSNETAKGEDLRDEFVLPLEHNANPIWDEFRQTAREFANARSRLAAAILDGYPDASLRDEVATAVENRQRALEVARADTPSIVRHSRRAESILHALSSDQDAFVHLFMLNGRLSSVIGRVANGSPHYELLPYSEIMVQRFTNAVGMWSRLPHARVGEDWYRYFGMLIAMCEGLIRPLAATLARQGIAKVFLSPTAPLDLLPLHAVALEDNQAIFLGDVFADIAYMPTAHMLMAVRQTKRRPATCPAVVVAREGSALFEAEMVADIYEEASLLAEAGATPDSVLQAMTGARIVHITSHGFTHAYRWASGIELSGASRGESTLTTSRILADADLSSVDLVVLNACRTGTHESTARVVQTLRGVESAFLVRGAKAVVSTLWEITNLHAAVFSVLLHTQLADGESVADSYRATIAYLRHGQWRSTPRQSLRALEFEAILDEAFAGVFDEWREHLSRQANDDPFFWAAFKITGSL